MFRSVSGLKRKHIDLYIGCVYTARISYILVGVLNMSDWVLFSKCFLDEPVINRSTSGDFVLFCSESIYRGIFLEVNFIFSFSAFSFKLKSVPDIDLSKKKLNCLEFHTLNLYSHVVWDLNSISKLYSLFNGY